MGSLWSSLVLAFALLLILLFLSPYLDSLRQLGIPIPYCTTKSLAVACKYSATYTVADIETVSDSETVVAALPPDFNSVSVVNALCSSARQGNNVLVILDRNSPLYDTLVSCGARVRFAPVQSFLLCSDRGLLLSTNGFTLYTDCKDVSSSCVSHLKGVWANAP